MTAAAQHPLGAYGLDMLARGAARLRGGRLAVAEHGEGAGDAPLIYRDLDALSAAFAARARECGLGTGDVALIVGANRISVIVAVLGALAAGVEPVLVPAHADAPALSFLARSTGAAALFALLDYDEADWESALFEAAASAPDVRVVGALAGEAGDTIDFSLAALQGRDTTAPPAHATAPGLIGFATLSPTLPPRVDRFQQSALVAEGLDLVAQLALSSETPILATLSPASRAGLVAGPIAALLSGAPLHLVGPFAGADFLAAVDALDGFCLVAPAPALADFAAAGALARAASLAVRGPVSSVDLAGEADFAGKIARLDAQA